MNALALGLEPRWRSACEPRSAAVSAVEGDAEEGGGFADRLAAVDGVVDGGDGAGRVEVVVERAAHLVERLAVAPTPAAEAPRQRSRRAAALGMIVSSHSQLSR